MLGNGLYYIYMGVCLITATDEAAEWNLTEDFPLRIKLHINWFLHNFCFRTLTTIGDGDTCNPLDHRTQILVLTSVIVSSLLQCIQRTACLMNIVLHVRRKLESSV